MGDFNDPVSRFLANARAIALHRPVNHDLGMYERFKAELSRMGLDHETYQRTCTELARICGV